MSVEPLVSVQPVHLFDPADPVVTRTYLCDVSVVDDKVETMFTLDGHQVEGPPIIASDTSTQFDFKVTTEGYFFEELSRTLRDSNMGSFRWDFDPLSPTSQMEAGFRVPPGLWTLDIAPDGRSASMTVTNRYLHSEPYLYSLFVGVDSASDLKKPLAHDPTLIEDPYDGPR